MVIVQLLRSKPSGVTTVAPSTSIRELLDVLADNRIGAAVVVDDDRAIRGIVSERDVVRRLRDHGADLLGMPVERIMTHDVVTCSTTDTVEDLMSVMTNHRIRHVPVLDDDGRLTGIVSIGDVVKSRIGELEGERDDLISYIGTR
jgi:CBS domain-containing protein